MPIGPLARQDLCDPLEVSLFPSRAFDTVRLYEWVEKATVCPTEETVDGFECWRLEVFRPVGTVEKYQFWLDPTIGFCPRRFAIVRPGLTVVNVFSDYREVADGVWYPMNRTFDDPKGGYQMITRVRSITVGKPFPKEDLIISFSSGTRVRDDIVDMEYVVP